jgi:hypothetical protein
MTLNTRSMRFSAKACHGQVVYVFEVVRSSITFPRGGGGRHWCIYVRRRYSTVVDLYIERNNYLYTTSLTTTSFNYIFIYSLAI